MAVVATNNPHKIQEIRELLGTGLELLTLDDVGFYDELAEDQDTIEGNAIQKASYVYKKFRMACFADDSGLEVDALGGAPGVYSARYAGPARNSDANIDLLLNNLSEERNRRAHFRTVIAYADELGAIHTFDGVLNGTIITERRGNQGFGYDPVFLPEGRDKTLAEMSIAEKNLISHRSMAVRKLANFLNANS